MHATLGLIHFHTILQSRNPFHTHQCMASRRFGRHTLLDWMIGRVSEAHQLQQIAVLAPPELSPRVLERIPPHVQIVPCPGKDVLQDLLAAAEMAQASALVLVGIEQPFVDPSLLDELVLAAEIANADYAAYQPRQVAAATTGAGKSGKGLMPASHRGEEVGVGAQWCTTTALRKLDSRTSDRDARQLGVQLMAGRPQEFKVATLALPLSLDRQDLRLAIHNAEDWEHAHMIFEALGPEGVDWHRITRLLDQNPEIRQRMARLNGAEPMSRPHLSEKAMAVS